MKCENILVTSSKGENYIVPKVRFIHSDEPRVIILVSTKRHSVDILFRDQDIELSLTDEETQPFTE